MTGDFGTRSRLKGEMAEVTNPLPTATFRAAWAWSIASGLGRPLNVAAIQSSQTIGGNSRKIRANPRARGFGFLIFHLTGGAARPRDGASGHHARGRTTGIYWQDGWRRSL